MTTPLNDSIPEGLCQCGCGRPTPPCRNNDARKGYVKGLPHRLLQGHGKRARTQLEKAVPFKIDGVYCRLVPLTRGMYSIVDESDYWNIGRFKWTAIWSKNGKTFYAMRHGPRIKGKQTTLLMHREILGLGRDDSREVDHIEPKNAWDNRRKNLRQVNHEQNMWNRGVMKHSRSGLKGVLWLPNRRRYRVVITAHGVRKHVGYFAETEKDAAVAAYARAAKQLHGEFARF